MGLHGLLQGSLYFYLTGPQDSSLVTIHFHKFTETSIIASLLITYYWILNKNAKVCNLLSVLLIIGHLFSTGLSLQTGTPFHNPYGIIIRVIYFLTKNLF
jgi:hypothetical protein